MSDLPKQSRLANIFYAMKSRCENPKNTAYAYYGGRGITVCERWNKFKTFAADMGQCPPGYTLDRIDNSGPYSPQNCRWATREEQNRNTSQNVFLTYRGKTLCAAEWAREIGLAPSVVRHRIKCGWPLEKVLSGQKFNRHNAPGAS